MKQTKVTVEITLPNQEYNDLLDFSYNCRKDPDFIIRRALKIYKMVDECRSDGGRVLFEKNDGKVYSLTIKE